MKKKRFAKVFVIITDSITGKFIEKFDTYWQTDNVENASIVANKCIETMTMLQKGEKWELESFVEVPEEEYREWGQEFCGGETPLFLPNYNTYPKY